MPDFFNDLHKTGYDKEEEYFYKLNRELIDRRRKELDEQRKTQEEKHQSAAYWMKCPKCGNQMFTHTFSGLLIDRCSVCEGIYLDQGELEILLEAKEHQTFIDSIPHFIRRVKRK